MKQLVIIFSIILLSIVTFAGQAKPIDRFAQVVKDTNLVKKPSSKADKVTALKKDQNITIKNRQRAWYQVITENDLSGWIKMLEVRFSGEAKREGELGVKRVWNSITSGRTDTTVSTGVRGFDEEDLKKATAAPKQVALLASFSSDKKQASTFAKQASLKANDIIVKEGAE